MNNLGLPLPDGIQESLQPNQSEIDASAIAFPNLAQLNQVASSMRAEVRARIRPILHCCSTFARKRSSPVNSGHIADARLVPLRELSERVREIEAFKDRDIIAICRVGVRSTTAAAMLTGLGFDHVCNLKGGMLDWNAASLPVEH